MNTITLSITDAVLWFFYAGALPEPPTGTAWSTALLQLDGEVPEHDSATIARANFTRIVDPEAHLPPHLRKTKKPKKTFDCTYDFELCHTGTAVTTVAIIPADRIKVIALRTEATP